MNSLACHGEYSPSLEIYEMKKSPLIISLMLLITGASGAYGYFFIYESKIPMK